jgi:hypothetical protein
VVHMQAFNVSTTDHDVFQKDKTLKQTFREHPVHSLYAVDRATCHKNNTVYVTLGNSSIRNGTKSLSCAISGNIHLSAISPLTVSRKSLRRDVPQLLRHRRCVGRTTTAPPPPHCSSVPITVRGLEGEPQVMIK